MFQAVCLHSAVRANFQDDERMNECADKHNLIDVLVMVLNELSMQ